MYSIFIALRFRLNVCLTVHTKYVTVIFFLAVNSLVLAIYYYESCKMAFMKVTYWANKCLIIAKNLLLLDFKCQYSKAYIFPLSFGGSISGG